jgi:hypothetical protein
MIFLMHLAARNSRTPGSVSSLCTRDTVRTVVETGLIIWLWILERSITWSWPGV